MIKKFLILSILLMAVAGFSLSSLYATDLGTTEYTTEKLYFEPYSINSFSIEKRIDETNIIKGIYDYYEPMGPPNCLSIFILKESIDRQADYKITTSLVTFEKTVNGETSYYTEHFTGEMFGFYHLSNGYKPYYAVISYQKI